MNDITDLFKFTSFELVYYLIGVILSNLFILLILLYITIKIKRTFVTVFNCIAYAIFLVSSIFMINTLIYTSCTIIFVFNLQFVTNNDGEFRKHIIKTLKKTVKQNKDKTDEHTMKTKEMINNLVTAVEWLSHNKVGALITFEKDVPLDDYIKSGTIINSPFTPELVETIFYEGTRLHDGAIVIRNNMILAAAVYYQPSTKVVIGKFGARHRAALGISEVSDAITVIVSEETGRISITHNGMLDNIKLDELEKIISIQLL